MSILCVVQYYVFKLNGFTPSHMLHASTGKDINTKEIILHRNHSYEGVSNNVGSNNMNTVMQPCPAYGMYH